MREKTFAIIMSLICFVGIVLSWILITHEPLSIAGPIGLVLNAIVFGIWLKIAIKEK